MQPAWARRIASGATLAVLAPILAGGCSDDDADARSPEEPAGAEPGTLVCADADDDSADPTLDLAAVRMARVGDGLRVVVDHDAPPPAGVQVVWVVGFVSADGQQSTSLLINRRKNGDTTHAVLVDGKRRGLGSGVRVTVSGVAATFPIREIDRLGADVRWYSSLSIDGFDVDFCPGGAELRDVLDVVPLPLASPPWPGPQ